MKNFLILTESLNFIEENLCKPITRDDIANHRYVSLSSLEKLFRYALDLSIKDYISRRRMTQAAKDLVVDMSVTDVAMKYQYNSVEVFSRAFKRVWYINPSEFKEARRFTGLFPKRKFEYKKGDDLDMARKRVDMSEAYDFFRETKGSYVLCFDGRNLSEINAISRKAGDMAILEMVHRIDHVSTDQMLVMRICGDEFALITGLYDEKEVRKLADKVLENNGKPILVDGKEVPLSLWCGMIRIPESLRYSDFFVQMHDAIKLSKG